VAQSPHDSPAQRFRRVIAAVLSELLPEIAGRRHLPFRAKVKAVVPVAAGKSTALKPLYTATLQPLRADGSEDDSQPILANVPIQALWVGGGAAMFRLPEIGSTVRVAFDYGDPRLPVILGAVTEGQVVPEAAVGELVIGQSATAGIRIKPTGAIQILLTPGAKISLGNGTDELLAIIDEALAYVETQIDFSNGGGNTGPPTTAAILTALRLRLATLKA
jgi:hypothetical protein